MASPFSGTSSPGATAPMGRPPRWTQQIQRQLVRFYLYTNLPHDKIIRLLFFRDSRENPLKNSLQKNMHDLVDHDPRPLRPSTPADMRERLSSLDSTSARRPRESSMHNAADSIMEDQDVDMLAAEPFVPEVPALSSAAPLSVRWGPQVNPVGVSPVFNTPRPEFVPSAPTRQSTVLSSGTEISSASYQELKRVASDCSRRCLQRMHRLWHMTISSETDVTNNSSSSTRTAPPQPQHAAVPPLHPNERGSHPGLATAGDLLNAMAYSATSCDRGELHGAQRCWCAVANNVAAQPNGWYERNGNLSARGHNTLELPNQPLRTHDPFGNTPLHLAASTCRSGTLYRMLLQATFTDIYATNTAGQNFLHVLSDDWFEDLESPRAPLRFLLETLGRLPQLQYSNWHDLVLARDHYGRTFFHRMFAIVQDDSRCMLLLSDFFAWGQIVLGRDAFGNNPHRRNGLTPAQVLERNGEPSTIPLWPESGPATLSPNTETPLDPALVAKHAQLLQTVRAAHHDPLVEDDQGRNGLHCVAEAILGGKQMFEEEQLRESGRPIKRKYHSKQGAEERAGAQLRRLDTVKCFLYLERRVNVHDYDAAGNTPLMAFIEHIPDGQDDKAHSLREILQQLIGRGEDVRARIEARNRRGETPLLVAARRGRKTAVTALLDAGANVHARDIDGRGVLALLDDCLHSPDAREHVKLYAGWEACRALLLHSNSRSWGVVGHPTVAQEWGLR